MHIKSRAVCRMTTCNVTVHNQPRANRTGMRGGTAYPKCDKPAVKYGLCEKHYARRVQLGGKP